MATGTEVVASGFDKRGDTLGRYPVWEKMLTFPTAGGGHVAATLTISSLNGILQKIIMANPASTSTGTSATLTIDDNADNEIFTSGAQAESDSVNRVFDVFEPLCGNIDFECDLDADPTDAHTVTVYLRGI